MALERGQVPLFGAYDRIAIGETLDGQSIVIERTSLRGNGAKNGYPVDIDFGNETLMLTRDDVVVLFSTILEVMDTYD